MVFVHHKVDQIHHKNCHCSSLPRLSASPEVRNGPDSGPEEALQVFPNHQVHLNHCRHWSHHGHHSHYGHHGNHGQYGHHDHHIMNIIILTKVVASEQSEWWLSVHDILHFLPHNDPTQVRSSFSQRPDLTGTSVKSLFG